MVMLANIKSKAVILGDNISTELIYPKKYLSITGQTEMARYALSGCDEELRSRIAGGEIIVAGGNFGNGCSRDQAVISLKAAGISCIVAGSFSRMFYRSAINQGLPVITADIVDKVRDGDVIEIDFQKGKILCGDSEQSFSPFPESIRRILESGGLIPQIRAKISRK